MISRDFYLNRIIRTMWNGDIKVITGIRCCGKSVLLFDLFYQYLLDNDVREEQIIKIELDQRRYYKYRNPIVLCEYVESIVNEDKEKKFYLFIDEVQLTSKVVDKENGGIEVTIYDMLNELKAYKNLDVYVTGIVRYIGAYYLELGGLDAIAFTGGIGENSALVREMVLERLAPIGVRFDREKNRVCRGEAEISAAGSSASVHIIPANEELMVVRSAYELIEKTKEGI